MYDLLITYRITAAEIGIRSIGPLMRIFL